MIYVNNTFKNVKPNQVLIYHLLLLFEDNCLTYPVIGFGPEFGLLVI